jgi:GNAT superfamily N-acetyltransferase
MIAPVALREMAADDIPAGLRLCRASGWNQTARDWEQFLELKPHGARVAVRAGSVVGTVTTVDYEDRFGWIGMVLVDPVARGQGVGTQLLQKGIELLEGIGCARLDATPAGHGLYLKLGFKDEYGLARMQRLPGVAAPASTPTPDARAMTSRDLPKVAAFDREVFGADRSAMLSWLLAGAPEYARVIERAGELRAYSFGRHGHDFEHLGPVVARDLVAARQLAARASPRRPSARW